MKFLKRFSIVVIVCICLFSLRIIDGFTSVETLTEKIHENSKRKFNGAVCNDGKISHSQGRGTCSWHNGVNFYFYKGEYQKTIEECRDEAIEKSWIDNIFSENKFENKNWFGTIKKINSEEMWNVRLTCRSENDISLYYPNTGCSGFLRLISHNTKQIVFREKLEIGKNICTDNGRIIIKINSRNLEFLYCWPNDNVIVAKGVLSGE